jgi:hypothetical protein
MGLQDRFDILVEGDIPGLRQQSRRHGQEGEEWNEGSSGTEIHGSNLVDMQIRNMAPII